MSENIYQIFQANPITTNASTDLMYFGQSPYGAGDDAAMTFANFNAQIVANGLVNQIAYYAASGNKISGLTVVDNGVLITSNAGVPSLLANGTAGYVLTANSGAPPSWQAQGYLSGAVLLNPSGPQTITGQNLTLSGATFAITGSGNLTVNSGTISIASGDVTASNGNFNATLGSYIAGSPAGGNQGQIDMYPLTAAKGRLIVNANNNAGNYNVIIGNASFGQSSTLTIPDPGASTGTVPVNTGSLTSGHLVSYNGTTGLIQDSGVVASTVPASTGLLTWTPSMTFSTPGDLSLGSVTASGYYTNIGNMVFAWFYYAATPTFTTSTGSFELTGFPFASNSGAGNNAIGSLSSSGIVYPTGDTSMVLNIQAGNSFAYLYGNGAAGTRTNVTAATSFTSATPIIITGSIFYSV